MIIDNRFTQRALGFIGQKINSPEQRLIQGITALMTQPFIDLKNKDVDEDTRMTAVARTLAKIIAGTLVGIIVRQASISIVKKFAQFDFIGGRVIPKPGIFGMLVPDFIKAAASTTEFAAREEMNLYQKGIGTFIGTMVGLYTNFKIDAPLTRKFTRYFYKKITGKELTDKQKEKSSVFENFNNQPTLRQSKSLVKVIEGWNK